MEDQTQNQQYPSLCRTGCGFFGSPTSEGLCSKCYKDYQDRKEEQQRAQQLSTESAQNTTPTASTALHPARPNSVDGPVVPLDVHTTQPSDLTTFPSSSPPSKTVRRNRCYVCRKKVGLTGFECRCGHLFCAMHRYADKHTCSYDYKDAGRKELEIKHPKVVATKVQKI